MARIKALIDSSFLFAISRRADRDHAQCVAIMDDSRFEFLLVDVTFPEVAVLFRRAGGEPAVTGFLYSLEQAHLPMLSLEHADLGTARRIKQRYQQFDFVDCCIMAIAERLKITQICTLDERDFTQYRPQFTEHLILLPLMENE